MREMRDSGVPWIGEMPKNWCISQLKHWVRVNNGKEVPEEVDQDDLSAIPVYGSGGPFKYTNSSMYKGKAVLFGRKGTLGKPLYAEDEFWVVDTMYYLTMASLNHKFCFYLLSAFDWIPFITKTAIPSIVASDIVAQNYPIPSREEQQRIADFLDAKCAEVDSILEQTRASIEDYKALKLSIITEAVTKGVRGERSMKETGVEWIGEIPTEWDVIKIKWLLKERNDRSEDGSEEPLSMSQKYGIIPTKEMDIVPNMASSFVGAKLAYKEDLVFNKLKAHLGVFSVSEFDGLVSPDYAVYHSVGRCDVKFLERTFKTPQYISEFRKRSTGVGAGLTRLYTSDLFDMYTALPSETEQKEIAAYLDEKCATIDSLIASKEALITELETYKKSLIYEYVTGKKEVL